MPTTTILGVCPDCNGLGFGFSPGGEIAFPPCKPCNGTGQIDHPLERGLKVTLQSGPDRYPYVVANVVHSREGKATRLWLLPGTEWTPERHKATLLTEITLRSDGQWREKGKTKKSGGIWTFGVADSYRSREV